MKVFSEMFLCLRTVCLIEGKRKNTGALEEEASGTRCLAGTGNTAEAYSHRINITEGRLVVSCRGRL